MKALDQLQKNLRKTRFYLLGGASCLRSAGCKNRQLAHLLASVFSLPEAEQSLIHQRVNYYNRLSTPFALPEALPTLGQFDPKGKSFSYVLDFKPLTQYFPAHWCAAYLFGDITHVPDIPSLLKSRPISAGPDNKNSVLLKLNQVRHYYQVDDRLPFEHKKSCLVWRGKTVNGKRVNHERLRIAEHFYQNPRFDIGDTYKGSQGLPYYKPFMSVPDQLRYKYILSIEGIDVATNLKWIMASNSLCFMRPPRFETWFMEGTLEPWKHYVPINEDYSDMEEKMEHFDNNPEAAKTIIANAKAHSAQFRNMRQELLISLLVMDKYFHLSGQY